jgi:outer membrane protein TolC
LKGLYGGAAADLSDLTKNPGLTWGVGPSINWSFPNLAGPLARIHAAKADTRAALAGFDSTVLQALKETEQSLTLYGAELDHHAALADAQAKSQKVFDMAHGQFQAGAISTLDLLSSEQGLEPFRFFPTHSRRDEGSLRIRRR